MEGITISKEPERKCHEARHKTCRYFFATDKECHKRIQNENFIIIQRNIIEHHTFCPYYMVKL